MKLVFCLLIIQQFLSFFSVYAEKINDLIDNNNSLKWEKVNKKDNQSQLKKIIWKSYQDDETYFDYEKQKRIEKKKIYAKDKKFKNFDRDQYEQLTQIEPHIPLNNYLDYDYFTTNIQWKSAFGGGAGGGTGNQNISARFDYGFDENTLLSLYLSESDDPLYNLIDNKITDNNWVSIALGYKKKIFESKASKTSISLASSFEYWFISSGSNSSKSIFNEKDDSLGMDRYAEFISSFSLPITKSFGNIGSFSLIPGMVFIPNELGSRNIQDNFYGNNAYMGTGLEFNISKNIKLIGSYSYLLGPGNNYFDTDINYSRKSIYSYGVNWDVNPIIAFQGKITNGYGSTPGTSLLTMPSDNQPLYYLSGTYKPYLEDTYMLPLEKYNKLLTFGGLTVENALIPRKGESLFSIDYDSLGSYFGSYKFSLSNIFQLQLISIGSYKGIDYSTRKNSRFFSNYINENNLNYRLGGKLLLLSPSKNDFMWLTSRISVGRNNETKDGYLFSDLTSTFKLSNWWALNISPKYLYSGTGDLSSLGLSSNVNLAKNLQFISETNIGLTEQSETNATFSFRYLYSPRKSIDIYVTNALGLLDIGQMLRSDEYKLGTKLNFIF